MIGLALVEDWDGGRWVGVNKRVIAYVGLFLCLAKIESHQLELGGPFLSYYLRMNGLRKKSCHCKASISEGFP